MIVINRERRTVYDTVCDFMFVCGKLGIGEKTPLVFNEDVGRAINGNDVYADVLETRDHAEEDTGRPI